MSVVKPLDGQAVGWMVVLCAIWALQQVAIKVAAEQVAPVMQIGLRSGGAAVLVGLLLYLKREGLPLRDGIWRLGLAVGGLFALEFMLVGEGLRYTSASHMVIFLYTAPIFAAIGLHWVLPAERLKPLQWLGIGVAFAGVVAAFAARAMAGVGEAPGAMLYGDALGLLGAVAWGATTVTMRCTRLVQLKPGQVLFYQLAAAFVLLVGAAAFTGQLAFEPVASTWLNLAFQTLVVGFASFLAWFWLLGRYLASRLGVLSFLTPLLGILMGVLLLDEQVEPGFLLGAVLVMLGILLVSGSDVFAAAVARRAAARERNSVL
ncbi:EamA family transporter [Pseudomonas typographi]|uniref:DMT family transporter n=1 Tax=Pseudomonas typographi TaxID=2715964 RepID=A0ABR7YVW1_9PSED|nr:DMT family transporter [Pseudomonas typographi]MBD1597337.1 DMT family transporter [Pseudomonas typographi]